jgi:hypothetical protein
VFVTAASNTSMISITLRCRKARAAVAFLSLLAYGITLAAEPVYHFSTVRSEQWLSPTSELKERLVRLRDAAIKGLLPRQDFSNAVQYTLDAGTRIQFDVEPQLFKTINPNAHSDTLKKLLNQQLGIQISPNTQFQFDFSRYWTVDDRQEVSVKVGLHFGFR